VNEMSDKINNGDMPASPTTIKPTEITKQQCRAIGETAKDVIYIGMTKRETIAMHLYAGMISAGFNAPARAVQEADNLLKALAVDRGES
jgi:hypothetical protein